jgi:poly(3-hydroxyalkanoate) synthetase
VDLLAAVGNVRDKVLAGHLAALRRMPRGVVDVAPNSLGYRFRAIAALELGGRRVELSSVGVPVLVIAGEHDVIAPLGAVRRGAELLTGAPGVLFESALGGHLGMLTGRHSRGTAWVQLDRFLDAHAWHSRAPRQSRALR